MAADAQRWELSPTPGEPVDVYVGVVVDSIVEVDAKRSVASVIVEFELT